MPPIDSVWAPHPHPNGTSDCATTSVQVSGDAHNSVMRVTSVRWILRDEMVVKRTDSTGIGATMEQNVDDRLVLGANHKHLVMRTYVHTRVLHKQSLEVCNVKTV